MKRFAIVAIGALIMGRIGLSTAPLVPQSQAQPGAIHGKVVREGTLEPIPDVQIFMNGPSGPPAASVVTPLATGGVVTLNGVVVTATLPGAPSANMPVATTDSSGSFVIRDVPAGKQVVTASKEGYFGPSRLAIQPSVQENTTVTPGKTTEVSFLLVPGGIIAGRILTATGENAADVPVQALRLSYQDANPILQPVSTRVTDDRGEYRLFKLPPGQYYVVAGQAAGPTGERGVRGAAPAVAPPPVASPNMTVRTFYPDTTEAAQALAINVRGGDETGGINIRVQPLSSSRKISGQVTTTIPISDMGPSARNRATQDPAAAAAAGAAPPAPPAPRTGGVAVALGTAIQVVSPAQSGSPSANLTLYPRDKGGPQDPAPGIAASVPIGEPQNGRFELPNIPRGTYDLFASLPDLTGYGPQQPPGMAASPVGYGRTIVEVGDRDLEGIRITVHPGVDLKGRITVDGSTSPAGANVRVSLQVDDSASRIANYQQVGRFQHAVSEDGSFTIPAVPEAHYRFQVTFGPPSNNSQNTGGLPTAPVPLNPNSYVADIRQAGGSVFDTGLNVGDQPLGSIDVVVRTDGGGLEGIVRGASQMPAGGATVVLIPAESRRANPSLYKSATSDAMGHFSLRGIAPGEYKVFAWQTAPGTAYRNADFLKKYEERGTPVNVIAGARLNATVDVIQDDTVR